METAFLLATLGFGYKIFSEAAKEGKKSVKNIGKLVGAFMMTVSLIGSICTIWCSAQFECKSSNHICPKESYRSDMPYHGMAHSKKFCPMMSGEHSFSESDLAGKSTSDVSPLK